MTINKQEILDNIRYTNLVYGRINKKLDQRLSKDQIERLILKSLIEADEKSFIRKGKNYYVSNVRQDLRITINANTFTIITVDRISKY